MSLSVQCWHLLKGLQQHHAAALSSSVAISPAGEGLTGSLGGNHLGLAQSHKHPGLKYAAHPPTQRHLTVSWREKRELVSNVS